MGIAHHSEVRRGAATFRLPLCDLFCHPLQGRPLRCVPQGALTERLLLRSALCVSVWAQIDVAADAIPKTFTVGAQASARVARSSGVLSRLTVDSV